VHDLFFDFFDVVAGQDFPQYSIAKISEELNPETSERTFVLEISWARIEGASLYNAIDFGNVGMLFENLKMFENLGRCVSS